MAIRVAWSCIVHTTTHGGHALYTTKSTLYTTKSSMVSCIVHTTTHGGHALYTTKSALYTTKSTLYTTKSSMVSCSTHNNARCAERPLLVDRLAVTHPLKACGHSPTSLCLQMAASPIPHFFQPRFTIARSQVGFTCVSVCVCVSLYVCVCVSFTTALS